jgi:microcystin-dependent protein
MTVTFTAGQTLTAASVNSELAFPTGVMVPYGGSTAPAQGVASGALPWLLCDGSAVSRTTYATLYAVIGTTYGTGDGSTTFDLPDLRGRIPMGAGTGVGGGTSGAAGTPPAAGATLTTRANGAWGGDERLHAHTHTATDAGHTHPYLRVNGNAQMYQSNVASGTGGFGISTTVGSILDVPSGTANVSIANNTEGGTAQNVQPYVVTNYIIKT